METKNRPRKPRTRQARSKQTFDARRVPPIWRRRLMAGVAICTRASALVRDAHQRQLKGGSKDDSS